MLWLKSGIIYLHPTTPTRVSTKLALVPEWDFSATYPVVSATETEAENEWEDTRNELDWVVDASPNGVLKEVSSGTETSYLYWDAKTAYEVFEQAASPPPSPQPGEPETFIPTRATLAIDESNSVVLEVAKVTPYLDRSLKALGLHVEARTSFITCWLPLLLKHEYVALRFLPQSVYERAASLTVEPTPDVVARIFMLFKSVEGDLDMWSDALERSALDVSRWAGIVGVDADRMKDAGLFRVIEWGGMEVVETDAMVPPAMRKYVNARMEI
ncbi:hypothetical protein DFP72DRAFT_1074479 [Ephemerocybe angulata]|uniref:Uncharacterized protein n=1 Tax=Ephemerocybe angulata TaxID=980116 RepID=A0A8H6HL57_9AGAR|nr:hypothetical protein DFP72DRAFT_1074479 [Tulosesus angulatus]